MPGGGAERPTDKKTSYLKKKKIVKTFEKPN